MWEAVSGIVTTATDRITTGIESLATSAFNKLDRINFDNLTAGLSDAKGLLIPLAGVATGFVGGLASGLPVIGPMFTKLTGPVGVVLALFTAMWTTSDELRTAVGRLFTAANDAFRSLSPVITIVSDLIMRLAGILGDTLGRIITTVIVPLVNQLADNVFPALIPVIEKIATLIGDLAAAFGGVLVTVLRDLVLPLLGSLINDFITPLLPLIGAVIEVFSGLAGILAGALIVGLQGLMGPLVELGQSLFPVIISVLELVIPLIASLASELLPILIGVFQNVIDAIAPIIPIIGDLAIMLKPILVTLFHSVIDAVGPIIGLFGELARQILPLLSDLLGRVAEATLPLIEHFGELLEDILPALAGMFERVFEAVAPLIGALTDLVYQAFLGENALFDLGEVTDWVGNKFELLWPIVEWVMDHIISHITRVIESVTRVITVATRVINRDWDGAWAAIRGTTTSEWATIEKTAATGSDAITTSVRRGMGGSMIETDRGMTSIERSFRGGFGGALGETRRGMDAIESSVRTGITSTSSETDQGMRFIENSTRRGMQYARREIETAMEGIEAETIRAYTSVTSTVDDAMGQTGAAIDAAMRTATESTQTAWGQMQTTTGLGAGDVVATTAKLPQQILDSLGNTSDLLVGAGKEIIGGLIRGIESQLGRLHAVTAQMRATAAGAAAAAATVTPARRDMPVPVAAHGIVPAAATVEYGPAARGIQATAGFANQMVEIARHTASALAAPQMSPEIIINHQGPPADGEYVTEQRLLAAMDHLAAQMATYANRAAAGFGLNQARHQAAAFPPLHA